VEDRPVEVSDCDNIDDYKFGLSGNMPGYSTGNFNDVGRSGIVLRYLGRYIHYALGTVSFDIQISGFVFISSCIGTT